MDIKKNILITRMKDNEAIEIEDSVVLEYPFTIYLNDYEFITMMATPDSLEALTVGFLVSENIISKYQDIETMTLVKDKGHVKVKLYKKIDDIEKLTRKRTKTSGCGNGTIFYNVLDSFKSKKLINREDEIKVHKDYILRLSKEFMKMSELFIETGGVHSAMLASNEQVLFFKEDIGRHNAIDKIIGEAILNNIKLNNKIIFVSGRISSEMLLKTAKSKVQIIISKSAPTSLAIDIASKLNVTLIGFVRGNRFNIYTHTGRIII